MSRCKVCKQDYTKRTMRQTVCTPACAVVLAGQVREKKARADYKARKEAIKTRSDWLREAQAAFNTFIRERDAHLPCISCGRFHTGAWDAGHYRSVGSMPALRFSEFNVHRQCVPCNQHKSGNVLEYRLGLIARIGQERVDWLEGPHAAAKYTIDDARRIKAEYRAKTKALKEAA